MKAWRIHQFGLSNLQWETVETPSPQPGEVRLELAAQSINYRDLMMIEGHYNPKQPLPLIPGSDGVGTVVEVGSQAEEALLGQRVFGLFSPKWRSGPPVRDVVRQTLGGPLPGTFAESIVLPAEGVLPVPEYLTDAEAATLPCAGLTAWSAVVGLSGIGAGDKVLVEGTGGVSIFALQFAKLRGAEVFVTSSSDQKLEKAVELGADATVNYRSNPYWGKAARQWAGDGVDLVVDVGGAETLSQALAAVKMGGTIAIIGVLSGAVSQFSVVPVLMGQVRLQGVVVGHRQGAEEMVAAMTEQRLRPVVDRTFGLSELPQALGFLASGRHFGKVTLSRRAGGHNTLFVSPSTSAIPGAQ